MILLCRIAHSLFLFSMFFIGVEQVSIISKRVRVRLEQVLPCKRKELKSEILAKLQKKFLSQEVCNIPCKILNLQLRCKQQKGQTGKVEKVSVSFDIELNESAIATSKFCNNSCVKCQMEERLKKMIYDLRIHADNNKLNVSVDDQIFTVLRKSVRVQRETNHCSKEKSRPRRRPGKTHRRHNGRDGHFSQLRRWHFLFFYLSCFCLGRKATVTCLPHVTSDCMLSQI